MIECVMGGRNTMDTIEEILRSNLKPKEKQAKLVEAVGSGTVSAKEFIAFFTLASYVDKGVCADAMKHISGRKPEILAPHIGLLFEYINHKAPSVKWGIQETIGNLAAKYPDETALAVPYLLQNTVEDGINTTVIRWCAAYCLSEIAKHCVKARRELVPKIKEIVRKETNSSVRNVYLNALKHIEK